MAEADPPAPAAGSDARQADPPAPAARQAASIYLPPWRIDVRLRRPDIPRLAPRARLAAAMRSALAAGGAPGPASIGLVLSDDAELAELNAVHMGGSGATDVLSFPFLPPEAFPAHPRRVPLPGTPGLAAAPQQAFVLPPGLRAHLGDVVVSVERAIAQAATGAGGQTGDIAWSAADELLLLVVHGTLHVCGWDHAERVEEAAMRRLEREILAGVGVSAPRR